MNQYYEKIKNMSVEELLNSFIDFLYKKDNEEAINCELYKIINETPIDYKKIYKIIPFLNEEKISLILKYDKDYSISFLLSLVDVADEDDLTKQAIYLLKRHNLTYILPLLPYVDEDTIREEYTKYYRNKKSI